MSTFIVRIELHPSDQEQAYSAVHHAMQNVGFSRIYRDAHGQRHHLPSSEYCITTADSVDAVRDLAAAAATQVTTLFMLLVSETTHIAFGGLVPVKEPGLPAPRLHQPLVTKAA